MARPSMNQIRNIGDINASYRWDLSFINVPNALRQYDSEQLNARCESSTIPKLTGSSTEIRLRGNKIKTPGIYDYDGIITLTFIETVNNYIRQFVKAWKDLCWRPGVGTQENKRDLEASILLRQLDNQDSATWEYSLYGCFYEDVDPGTFDAETPDQRPALTLSYDWFDERSV